MDDQQASDPTAPNDLLVLDKSTVKADPQHGVNCMGPYLKVALI